MAADIAHSEDVSANPRSVLLAGYWSHVQRKMEAMEKRWLQNQIHGTWYRTLFTEHGQGSLC
jgi:hypothetical protein